MVCVNGELLNSTMLLTHTNLCTCHSSLALMTSGAPQWPHVVIKEVQLLHSLSTNHSNPWTVHKLISEMLPPMAWYPVIIPFSRLDKSCCFPNDSHDCYIANFLTSQIIYLQSLHMTCKFLNWICPQGQRLSSHNNVIILYVPLGPQHLQSSRRHTWCFPHPKQWTQLLSILTTVPPRKTHLAAKSWQYRPYITILREKFHIFQSFQPGFTRLL